MLTFRKYKYKKATRTLVLMAIILINTFYQSLLFIKNMYMHIIIIIKVITDIQTENILGVRSKIK